MNIALIDHPFHKKTKSTVFIEELLRRLGDVDLHWEENWWNGKGIMDLVPIINGNYDLVVCLQTEFLAPYILRHNNNVVIIPMYDGAHRWNDRFWKQCTRARIINFCRTAHEHHTRLGCDSYYFKFAPNPADFKQVENFENLNGFFWERLPNSAINADFVINMLSKTAVNKLHIHQAPDDGVKSDISSKEMQITHSEWFEEFSDFQDVLRKSNVFIQPREREGIGKAFLEAMAMGQCVIAPGFPTMNEYITNAVNGLLFSPSSIPNFEILKPKFAEQMGRNARFTIESIYEEWKLSENRFLDILSEKKGTRDQKEGFLYEKRKSSKIKAKVKPKTSRKQNPKTKPGRVTVVTVAYNAGSDILRTIESVKSLKYPDIEYLVLDGGSTDDTLKTLSKHTNDIDYWRSEPDLGPFDAMNKAARYATGEYVIFMNAGDTFYQNEVFNNVFRPFQKKEDRPDIIYGHHFWKKKDGAVERKIARSFNETWGRLLYSRIDLGWLAGIPCHQSTLTKTEFLREHPYDLSYHLAADHELLFRAKKMGARVEHCNCTVSIYEEGGLTSRNIDRLNVEWYDMAKKYSPDNASVDEFYSPAAGFSSLDHVADGKKHHSVLQKRLTEEPFKNKVARRLQNHPIMFDVARKAYKLIDRN